MDSYCSKCDKYHHPSRKESHSKKKSRRGNRGDQGKRNSCSPCKIKIITKSNIPGPTGPTGPTGPAGSEGTGHTGPNNTGHTGPDGPQGEIGITLPSTICLNYVTPLCPNGVIIGKNPNAISFPIFDTIVKFLYTGPIVERTVTLLVNVTGSSNKEDSDIIILLTMLEEPCSIFPTIVFGGNNIGTSESSTTGVFGDKTDGIWCITMKVTPTITNSVWQLGIDNSKLGQDEFPIESVSVLSLCIN